MATTPTCPIEFAACYSEDEWQELLWLLDENDISYDAPMGDVESALSFTWDILWLTPWELVYLALPMGTLAFYALSIYAGFKWIQKRFQ